MSAERPYIGPLRHDYRAAHHSDRHEAIEAGVQNFTILELSCELGSILDRIVNRTCERDLAHTAQNRVNVAFPRTHSLAHRTPRYTYPF
jgi:hypothetical protein